uniref:RICIN domain-containing protein n=1 Tax=Streptomyces sp. NBC_00093 TaxID=2975649 RepID=A0AAU2ADP1_9ACTN
MTASSEDPTAEAATARPDRTDAASLPLPRRSRGPSAIAEAAAALGSAATSEPEAVPDPESVPPPPMSAAAAEFAALTGTTPGTAAPGIGTGDTADHRADVTAAPSRSVPLLVRYRKMLLAAAVGTGVGVLLVGSVFLVSGGDDSKGRPAAAGTGSDTVPDSGENPAAPGSASPSGGSSALEANATNVTESPGGQPTPGGSSPASGDNTGDTTPTSKGDTENGGAQTGSSPGESATAVDSGDADTDVVEGVLIRSHSSDRCIDVSGGSSTDHTRLQIWDCTGAARQQWQFSSDGTVRALGKCMDVDGGSREDGAWIKLVTCNGTGAQRFRLNAAHDLVNIQADKCVDVTDQGTGNGSELQLWSCTGGDNQKWSTG